MSKEKYKFQRIKTLNSIPKIFFKCYTTPFVPLQKNRYRMKGQK